MMNNTLSVLDLLGIEEQDLWTCIKERLSISPLNLVLKAKEKIKMRDESLLSVHYHVLFLSPAPQWEPGKQDRRHLRSL